MGIGNLRVHQNINQPFCILKYIIIARWIVRLRTEDRLLTIRSVDRCAQARQDKRRRVFVPRLIPELVSSMRLVQTPFVETDRRRRRCPADRPFLARLAWMAER
jgi:hypothetical protein